jgi:hypothetical protein
MAEAIQAAYAQTEAGCGHARQGAVSMHQSMHQLIFGG